MIEFLAGVVLGFVCCIILLAVVGAFRVDSLDVDITADAVARRVAERLSPPRDERDDRTAWDLPKTQPRNRKP